MINFFCNKVNKNTKMLDMCLCNYVYVKNKIIKIRTKGEPPKMSFIKECCKIKLLFIFKLISMEFYLLNDSLKLTKNYSSSLKNYIFKNLR